MFALALRLANGVAHLPVDVRQQAVEYLLSAQNDDGGFAGRQGDSNLYYTSFAIRSIAMLGKLNGELADRIVSFLEPRVDETLPNVDFFSLVLSAAILKDAIRVDIFAHNGRDLQEAVVHRANVLRCKEGGYAKVPGGQYASTYHTFLVALSKQTVGLLLDEGRATVDMLLSRRCDDGGFVEIPKLRHGGTNPTSAAIELLDMLNALQKPVKNGGVRFLSKMQNEEGGFRANTRVPIADLLSTFTATVTLTQMSELGSINQDSVRQFVEKLRQKNGGFCGGNWDHEDDVEYTFYGLATLGLLKQGK